MADFRKGELVGSESVTTSGKVRKICAVIAVLAVLKFHKTAITAETARYIQEYTH